MTKFEKDVENFIKLLSEFPNENDKKVLNNVFNPWKDYDKNHDFDESSPQKRCCNLYKYFKAREKAEYILIAEAPGYQGCHFSGIPMTSERLILTNNAYGLEGLERTSDYREQNNKLAEAKIYTTKYPNGRNIAKTVIKNGFAEPTATIVWKQMVDELDIKPTDFVLWNAFPFHPHDINKKLSNRKPTPDELSKTNDILKSFVKLYPNAYYISIGEVSKKTLQEIKNTKISYIADDKHSVVHPSYGNANKFREQIADIINYVNLKTN